MDVMSWWTGSYTRWDRIRDTIGFVSLVETIAESSLLWFEHVWRKSVVSALRNKEMERCKENYYWLNYYERFREKWFIF